MNNDDLYAALACADMLDQTYGKTGSVRFEMQAANSLRLLCDEVSAMREALGRPQKAIAWGMPGKNWEILDVISPEEHDREEGGYTVPLFAAPLYGNRIELLDAVREEAALICLDYHRAGGTAWDCWNALRKREENGKD